MTNEQKFLVYDGEYKKIYMTEQEIFEDFKYTLTEMPQRDDEISSLIKEWYRLEDEELAERIAQRIKDDEDITGHIGVDGDYWIYHKDLKEDEEL